MEDRTKKVFIDTGKKPNQLFKDSIINKRILEDVSSRTFIRDYVNLLERKNSHKKIKELTKYLKMN